MKTKNIALMTMLGAIVLGIGLMMSPHNRPNQTLANQGHHDIWYCPMHPHYTSDRPGQCPICGMNLVKRETVSQKSSRLKGQA